MIHRSIYSSIGLLFFFTWVSNSSSAPMEAPQELPGSLVLVGGGKLPDSIRDRFFVLAGKEKAKIIVIPTASVEADDPKAKDSFLKPWSDLKPASVEILHTKDRKMADSPEFVKPLQEATAVWFSGGDQNRFMAIYKGTLVEKELTALFQRGGVIGGTSAGAAIASEWMMEGSTSRAKIGPGLGWLPGFVVDPHFLQRNRFQRLLGVLHQHPQLVGLGIDESTALIVHKRTLQVIGDSYVTVCLAPSKSKTVNIQTLKTGERADLFQLRRSAMFRMDGSFPPEKPSDSIVAKGSLVIGGGGGLSGEIVKRFIELAGGNDAPLLVVSTAYDDPVPKDPGEAKLLRKFGAKKVSILHTRNRKDTETPEFVKDLKEAKGVWFSGGRQWRFVDSYEGTICQKLFEEVLNRGGVIGGSSAGASIQAEYMPRGHPLGNLVMMAEGYERGFGYLKGVAIDQHFFARKRTADMTDLVNTYPQLLGIGIDEGTAIIVQGSVFEVMGRGNVAIYDRQKLIKESEKDYEEIKPGMKYDMKKRVRVESKKE